AQDAGHDVGDRDHHRVGRRCSGLASGCGNRVSWGHIRNIPASKRRPHLPACYVAVAVPVSVASGFPAIGRKCQSLFGPENLSRNISSERKRSEMVAQDIEYVELYVGDKPAAVDFYRKSFGFTTVAESVGHG